ncbi:hypothetical protein Tco_1051931 [Tanacetum coccineum]
MKNGFHSLRELRLALPIRLETTVPQKEEKFQVVINLIKKSSCFKAFTPSLQISQKSLWQAFLILPKRFRTDSYEFLLSNKKYVVNVDIFRMILDICSRVEGVNFTDVPDDDTTLAFLIKLGYKGRRRVKHLKTAIPTALPDSSSHIQSLPQATQVSLIHLKYQHYHTIKDDGIVSRLKFVRIGEDYQEYRLAILEVMLNDAIKQSESYQMFIKYSTGQIPPKKSRGKGKSISKTKAEEAEAARQVHATHARIVTESVPEPTRRRKSGKVTSDPPKKLKGGPISYSHVPEAQVKELVTIPGVPNESTVIYATSSEGTGTKPGVPDEEKDITKEHVILE